MFLTLMTMVACVEDVGKDKVEAKVEEVAPAPAAAPEEAKAAAAPVVPTPAGDAWAINTETSSIQALGAKVTATHPIVFKSFAGKAYVDGDTLTGVQFDVDMASLEADAPKLTQHLKTPDFFDIEKFPKSTFASTAVTAGSETEGMTHTIEGIFTIHGQAKKVTFPAKVGLADGQLTAETEFVLDRKDFGVVYPGRPDDLVQDNVAMTIKLAAAKPEA